MSKLNQIIAVAQSKKAAAKKALERAYHLLQKTELYQGLEKSYQPQDEDGEQLPPESKRVEYKVSEVLDSIREDWTNMVDVVVTNDTGNSQAKANIKVGDQLVAENVPVTSLIFLEKQLTDLHSLIGVCPTLSTSDSWKFNQEGELWESETYQTHRTKKEQRPIVLYDATETHPAQCQLITQDKVVGFWNAKKLSGAISDKDKRDILKKVSGLKEAVVKAREEANSTEVENVNIGDSILDYLLK